MQKPSNPKGTRDFSPAVLRKRNYILDIIKEVFEKYGFEALETPALENLSTLMGKYGEEGDKLLFKILNSGDISSSIKKEDIESGNNTGIINSVSKRGLRYDLTVPFARYVVQHRNEINFPFRRYQIQPVWRADNPQKGRFREFTQCDADIIGSSSLLNEADLILIYGEVFSKLGLKRAVLKINHRKFLEAIAEELELDFPLTVFSSSLDKLDKIGEQGVFKELERLGMKSEKGADLFKIITQSANISDTDQLTSVFKHNSRALSAIADLKSIFSFVSGQDMIPEIKLDFSLARGLDYYTGCIFEAIVPDSGIGSISGGGRYDNLTDVFGMNDVSGVGISFGIDRIYEIMEAENLFPNDSGNRGIMFTHFNSETQRYAYELAARLRQKNIKATVYPDIKNLKKQLDYANRQGFQWVVVVGEEEMEKGVLNVKNMQSGDNLQMNMEELALIFKDNKI